MEIKISLTEKQLCSIITDLCDLPKTFKFKNGENTIILETNIADGIFCSVEKAKLQEFLRIRFSMKERKEMNQEVIKAGKDLKYKVI